MKIYLYALLSVWPGMAKVVEMLFPWWRHHMETFAALLVLCAGNSPVTGEFPTQRPVTRSFDVFFDLCLNKRLSKQSLGWWFRMPSHPLWRNCNAWKKKTHLSCMVSTAVGDTTSSAGIILCMYPGNERRCYIVTPSLIGWVHTQNDPCSAVVLA